MLTNKTGFQHKVGMLYRQYTYAPNNTMCIYMHIIHLVFSFHFQVGMHLFLTLQAHLVTFLSDRSIQTY